LRPPFFSGGGLRGNGWYVLNPTPLSACKLASLPRHACQIVHTSNMEQEDLAIGIEIAVRQGTINENDIFMAPG